MHTPFLRANVVFFFSLTLLFVLSMGCALQYFVAPRPFDCSIENTQVHRFRQFNRPAQRWEHAQGTFYLNTDLSPVWDWNTQQLFVYVAVEWESEKRFHSVVVWDRIIRHKEDAKIQQLFDFEYTINDQWTQLKGQNLIINLHYDVMPVVGMLRAISAPTCSQKFAMPKTYIM